MTDRRHVLQMGALADLALAARRSATTRDDDGTATRARCPAGRGTGTHRRVSPPSDPPARPADRRFYQYQLHDEHAAHLRALGWEAPPAPVRRDHRPRVAHCDAPRSAQASAAAAVRRNGSGNARWLLALSSQPPDPSTPRHWGAVSQTLGAHWPLVRRHLCVGPGWWQATEPARTSRWRS